MAKPKQDLTASRWASPEVRREREFQTRTPVTLHSRTPSPHKLSQTQTPGAKYQHHTNNSSQIPTTATTSLAPVAASAPLLPVGGTGATATATPETIKPTSAAAVLSTAQRQYLARQTELQRFRRLFRRLAWKANSLTHWSHRALSLAQEFQNQSHETTSTITQQRGNGYNHGHPSTPTVHGPCASLGRYEMVIDPIEAERQFKIDFFEFYTLLERGLVCLLAVWGIVITSAVAPASRNRLSDHGPSPQNNNATKNHSDPIIGDSRTFHGVAHRFHANVLDALDHPSNPLYPVLGAGSGDARAYIGVAKEFRNKWKDVEQRPDDSFVGDERVEEEWDRAKVKRYEKVLQDLRLDELLGTVLAALEEAGKHAEAEVARLENLLGNSAAVDARNSRRATAAAAAETSGQDGDFDMMDAPFEVASGIAGVAVPEQSRDNGNGSANGYGYAYEYRYDHDYDEMEF
ncbi:hypothetical protein HRR83_000297 [Exophiala dermatitidis]|nr:hypothetical protein HRR73_002833 [Exophiala dermatitidis]KAJ4527545.1 hypothetical protein HRR74_000299 [Exophiala dermatitidis]KAJ4531119.1 hypothetical protein HRR76_008795 [Exophiala dermatitidis]KAJ4558285.1 hypothetical protein HRR77_000298 [Exophiala dermatitidis]KAJ4581678.1 hypothetical protein HRR79_000696 [Exophiala dermatitidis]